MLMIAIKKRRLKKEEKDIKRRKVAIKREQTKLAWILPSVSNFESSSKSRLSESRRKLVFSLPSESDLSKIAIKREQTKTCSQFAEWERFIQKESRKKCQGTLKKGEKGVNTRQVTVFSLVHTFFPPFSETLAFFYFFINKIFQTFYFFLLSEAFFYLLLFRWMLVYDGLRAGTRPAPTVGGESAHRHSCLFWCAYYCYDFWYGKLESLPSIFSDFWFFSNF